MRDIEIKIISRQLVGSDAEDKIEFLTEGKLSQRNGAVFIQYDESELSGYQGCKTVIKLRGQEMKMMRSGRGSGFDAEMVFLPGKRLKSKYETPYGMFDMEVLTRTVTNGLSEEGVGIIHVDYDISVAGLMEGRNIIEVHVKER